MYNEKKVKTISLSYLLMATESSYLLNQIFRIFHYLEHHFFNRITSKEDLELIELSFVN